MSNVTYSCENESNLISCHESEKIMRPTGITFYLECKYLTTRGKPFSRNCFSKHFTYGLFMYAMASCLCTCIYIYIYICVIHSACFVICKSTVHACSLSVVICICVDPCSDSSSVTPSLTLYL